MLRVTCCLLLLAGLARGDSEHTKVTAEAEIEKLAGPLRYLMVRPSDLTRVNISGNLVDVEVSSDGNSATIGGWMHLKWTDHRLAWDGGAEQTRVSPASIWKPDLNLFNRVPVTAAWVSPTPALVFQSGLVVSVPLVSFTVRCQRSQTDDSDRITCPFTFGSWTHTVEELDLVLASNTLDTSEFISNGRWAVESTSLVRKENEYDCCHGKYATVVGELVLKPQLH